MHSCVYLAGVALTALPLLAVAASGAIDCTPLDPRIELSKRTEGKIQGSAESLFKMAKAEGAVEGRINSVTRNLQQDVPLSERGNAQNRLLYVFCEMLAKDSLPADKKFELYLKLLDRMVPPANAQSAPPKPPQFDRAQSAAPNTKRSGTPPAPPSSRPKMSTTADRQDTALPPSQRRGVADAAARGMPAYTEPIVSAYSYETVYGTSGAAPALSGDFAAFIAGKPVRFDVLKRTQGIGRLSFTLQYSGLTLTMSEVQFSLDEAASLGWWNEHTQAVRNGHSFGLVFRLENDHTAGSLGRVSLCCWRDPGLNATRAGVEFLAPDAVMQLTSRPQFDSTPYSLWAFIIPEGYTSGSGGPAVAWRPHAVSNPTYNIPMGTYSAPIPNLPIYLPGGTYTSPTR